MTVFGELAETDGDNEFKAWLSKLMDAKQEIVSFVSSRRQNQPTGEFAGYLKGSFNLSLVIKFNDGGPKPVIRFPKPGHTATAFREEKVRNEVNFLELMREKTTIPVPRVLIWGTTEDSPQRLGPFMIMDYVDGTSLATLLKQPTQTGQDEVILATDVDDTKLDYVYDQLADYTLQLSQLDFSTIGAISKTPSSNGWAASSRALTYNMNELHTVVSNYPTDGLPTSPFTSAKDFLHSLADEHLLISRYCFADTGPFKPYCDDLQPTNMLADPNTFRITAVLDWEFTNSMPAQFSYHPPWWLLLLGPDMWLEHHSIEEFVTRYVPRMEQFLRALERGESEGNTLLSVKMRDSWATGRFWFDYGIRKSFDIDAVYWAALHKEGDDALDDGMREEMEKLVDVKMEQLKAYDAECQVRFP
ncbi:phosphotransferase enzyme family protein-like protein [Clohesyomyces aquaticus]|uniref:Phosphotransferase enzyme family protein-like protein n=1 Tax=Clohesyomyces aquaticus TaxID=1231657 RepID=A0A1Y1YK76_9PLEO|nr:phosphotransferase enzyme family protein-like protein [Clohesyomyces aquaticus]